MHNPASKNVLVISHRGDWRNWPENSIDAIESVIDMGVDIMEFDLKLTSDSERDLFRKWLPVFDNESIDKLITEVCADVSKWTKKDNAQVLERVQRVVFLIEALPRQKQNIVALIPHEVIRSFPKDGKEGRDWCEIVKVFSR